MRKIIIPKKMKEVHPNWKDVEPPTWATILREKKLRKKYAKEESMWSWKWSQRADSYKKAENQEKRKVNWNEVDRRTQKGGNQWRCLQTIYQNFQKGIGLYISIYNLEQQLLIPGTKWGGIGGIVCSY